MRADQRADLSDGMKPEIVFAVYCEVCGEYAGQEGDFEVDEEEISVLCRDCLEEYEDE